MKLKLVNGEWEETYPEDPDGFYLDGKLKQKLDNVLYIIKKGFDCIILIDGDRRTGKSNLGTALMWYLTKGRCSINNYASGMLDASKKISEAPDSTEDFISCLQVDEASLVFNSKDTMVKEQKQLMKVIDVVGQKNMVFIIILPTIFDLNRSIVHKARFLLHVYTDSELNRGRFAYFGKNTKNKLFELGKRNFCDYSKPEAEWLGRFTDFKAPFYDEYIKLKKKSLLEALNPPSKVKEITEHDFLLKYVPLFKKNCPEVINKTIAKGFGISLMSFYRYNGRGDENSN